MHFTPHTHGWFDFLSSAPSLIKENDVVGAWNDLIDFTQRSLSAFDVSTESFNALPQPQQRRIVEILQDYRDFGKSDALLDQALAEFIVFEDTIDIPTPVADVSVQDTIDIPDPVLNEEPATQRSAPTTSGGSRPYSASGNSNIVHYSVAGALGIGMIFLAHRIYRA